MKEPRRTTLLVLLIAGILKTALGLQCHQCISENPTCPEGIMRNCDTNDKCVKITLNQQIDKPVYKYDCLSVLQHMNADVPTDTSNGCRPANRPPGYAIYPGLSQSGNEADVTDSIYCFCDSPTGECDGTPKNSATLNFNFAVWTILIFPFVLLCKYLQ